MGHQPADLDPRKFNVDETSPREHFQELIDEYQVTIWTSIGFPTYQPMLDDVYQRLVDFSGLYPEFAKHVPRTCYVIV